MLLLLISFNTSNLVFGQEFNFETSTIDILNKGNIIDAQNYGIEINGDISPNFSKIVERSRLVAEGMSKGIQFLFKKNKIEHLKGIGKIVEKGLVEVTNSEGNKTNFHFSHQSHSYVF